MSVKITGELARQLYEQILSKDMSMHISMDGDSENPIITITGD